MLYMCVVSWFRMMRCHIYVCCMLVLVDEMLYMCVVSWFRMMRCHYKCIVC